jgi:pimeloyl-[acyl-carrier protein] methyl ester esterase
VRPLPLLLLPGIDGSGRLFERFLAAGRGGLDLRVLPYPRDRFLGYDELESLVMGALPRGPFALLGESFGGPLALRVAARAPRGLVGVVLAATFHRRPARPLLERALPLAPAFFRLPLPAHAVRLLLAGGDAGDDLVREVQDAVARVPGKVMAARAREAMAVDATEALRRCPAPVLVLSGAEDRLLRGEIPGEVRALRPDADVRLMPTPHLVLQSRPAESMAAIEEFLARAAAPRPVPAGA